jgi:CubicO group peptidase (beta-lactamase class C family)
MPDARPALAPLLLLSAALAQSPLPADFDAHVETVREQFAIPGLAVAVVGNGATLLARGYGVQRLGEPMPVDERTNFGIASNSKVFTAAALGLLVEQGRIGWEDRVQTHLPAFQLSDPYVSRELTVRDLLVHRSGLGLGAGDLLWWPGTDHDRKEVVRRLAFVPLATSFRNTYAYDNVLYLVAGELLEAVGGATWEEFVTEHLLRKAGMARSHASYSAAAAAGNLAGTHARVGDDVVAVAPDTSDATNPAGGIVSNAHDMARWLLVLLGRGTAPGGERVFSEPTWRELTALVTPIPIQDPNPLLGPLRPNFQGYALGLSVSDYRGRKLIAHSGGLPGYVSRVVWLPEIDFGIAVLTNQESMPGILAIVMRALDHRLGHSDVDWLARCRELDDKARARAAAARARAELERAANSRPSLPLARYAGAYRDAWYGDVHVEESGAGLRMRFAHTPALQGPLEHWQYDTFVARWDDRTLRADAFVTFALTPDGNIDQVKLAPFDELVDFSFDYRDLLLKPVRAP